MYLNKSLQVFVSCPSDVNDEKDMVRKACERVNKNLTSLSAKVQLIFRDFSEIIGETGKRPQQIINDTITAYDIFIGILFRRFGTPTGTNNPVTAQPFESGTEEEFFIATERKRDEDVQIYFFFKEQTGFRNSQEGEQALKVLRFKEGLTKQDWINSFTTTHEFENIINDLLNRIAFKIHFDTLIETKEIFEKAIFGEVDKSSFVPILPQLQYYIPRSVTSYEKLVKVGIFPDENAESTLLKDAILQQRKIVLLGNAGSGKSVELQQLAYYYQREDTPFVPIYKRLNTFFGEDIKDFLPKGFDQVDPEITIILFDGLDEIQPNFFNTAVGKIIEFAEANPQLRIIITCRTNFYELPTATFSGTLTGFEPNSLNDISLIEIKNYTKLNFQIDGDKFIQDAYQESFLDLIQKPFFLDILLKHYLQKGDFKLGRAGIIEEFILSRINLDKEHYKTTIAVSRTKTEILGLIEKVAFVMELMGKNFVDDDELAQILKREELDQIRYFTAFTKNVQTQQWMFEHNNIQEFLAARVLTKLSFEKLIKVISFAPLHEKVKPTWVNTISFFISIGSTEIVKELIDWLVQTEREIVIKFEPDRIASDLRIKLFKQIFYYYKEKNIWLSSNKFSDTELSRFAAFAEVLDFLLNEINDTENTHIVRLNAIGILDNFELKDFHLKYKQWTKESLLKILDNESPDGSMIHSILIAMAKLNITDERTVEYITKKYRNRKNQYVRAGLYRVLSASLYLDQYVDVFIDGINLTEIEEAVEDREAVNLMDETWLLKEGLLKIREPKAIKKILNFFKLPRHQRTLYADDDKEIFTKVLTNSFEAWKRDPLLFEDILQVFKAVGYSYDDTYAKIIIPFFEKTGKKWEVFKQLWFDRDDEAFSNQFLLELLVDKDVVQKFIQGYENRDFTNDEVSKLYQLLHWHFNPDHPDSNLVETFPEQIYKLTGYKIQIPERKDWKSINAIRTQKSFDILFDEQVMLTQIAEVFDILGKDELDSDDVWGLRKTNSVKDIDDYFPASVLELLRDFTMRGRKIDYNTAREWIEKNSRFNDYRIDEIYQYLHGANKDIISISNSQINFIEDWCHNTIEKIDLKKAVKLRDNNQSHLSIDSDAQKVWFFIRHFNTQISEEKLLDFTLFYDPETQNSQNEEKIITELETFVSKEKIINKVIENLAGGINTAYVWKNNATYAIVNNIKAAFPFIIKNLLDHRKPDHYRREILDKYFKKTKDFKILQDLLITIGTEPLRWDIIKIMIKDENSSGFLLTYLKAILSREHELFEAKLKAAKYLNELNDLDGLKFLAYHILEKNDPNFGYSSNLLSFNHLKNRLAIPLLLELLALAKQPGFQKDRFNSLESNVIDALYNIGIHSEENYKAVKTEIEKFIDSNSKNIQHLNFLHFNIRRIEDQLYMNKSKSYLLKNAINEFNSL